MPCEGGRQPCKWRHENGTGFQKKDEPGVEREGQILGPEGERNKSTGGLQVREDGSQKRKAAGEGAKGKRAKSVGSVAKNSGQAEGAAKAFSTKGRQKGGRNKPVKLACRKNKKHTMGKEKKKPGGGRKTFAPAGNEEASRPLNQNVEEKIEAMVVRSGARGD